MRWIVCVLIVIDTAYVVVVLLYFAWCLFFFDLLGLTVLLCLLLLVGFVGGVLLFRGVWYLLCMLVGICFDVVYCLLCCWFTI